MQYRAIVPDQVIWGFWKPRGHSISTAKNRVPYECGETKLMCINPPEETVIKFRRELRVFSIYCSPRIPKSSLLIGEEFPWYSIQFYC